ncbi:hypothetical protein [Steroidobacter cummioxidans]|uniref:hypothetical protein n=1 Tax=Steroidobacter cummioxidans TaxID=1803913 RepID=UPI00128FCF93|nr:hypothetical protein [Steroidobacter cummioxidans]
MRLLRVVSALVLLGLLQACGGGGGGGGGDGGGGGGAGFSIGLDRTSVTFEFFEGAEPPTRVINATASGEYTGNLYVGATVEGPGIDPTIPIVVSGTRGTISVKAAPGLAEGTYNGRINFLACSDAACTRRVGGTPIPVAYTVTVKRGVRFAPATALLTAQSGQGTSADVTIELPQGMSQYDVGAGLPEWLSVTNRSASSFTLAANSMPVGVYNASVRATSGGASGVLSVTYEVSAPPGGAHGILAVPETLAFGVSEGTQVTRTLQITPPTWTPGVMESIRYLGQARNWLTMTRRDGGFDVTASAAALPEGTYTAEIVFNTVPALESLSIPVALTVGPGYIKPATTRLNINSDTTHAQLSGRARIDIVRGGPVEWTASTTTPWLTITRASGLTGTDVEFAIDPAAVNGWANFTDHEATIRIGSPSQSLSPIDCDIEVQLRLAEVTGVGPHLLIAGQSSKIVVRGRGFSGLSAPLSRLRIDNASFVSAQVVNDSKMVVEAGALALGDHTVSITNALNRSLQTRDVRVIAEEAYAYKAIPVNVPFVGGPFLYDAERRHAYVVAFSSTLMRFEVTSSSTVAESVIGAGGRRIGLTPDGANFITGDQYGFSLLDRDTLAVVPGSEYSSFGTPGGSVYGEYPAGIHGLMVSNDSRLWYQSFRSLDINTKEIRSITRSPAAPSGGSFSPMTISRNGEKIVGVDASVNPAFDTYPLVYADAGESILHYRPDPVSMNSHIMLSDDGERVLVGYGKVFDGQLNLVGDIVLPSSSSDYSPLIAAISPDGAKVYVLLIRESDYNNSAPAYNPRIYVFDSSTPVTAPQTLPLEGYFEFDDYPGCMMSSCYSQTLANITPDGGALIFAGNRNFVVVPTNTPMLSAARNAGSSINTVRWNLSSGE